LPSQLVLDVSRNSSFSFSKDENEPYSQVWANFLVHPLAMLVAIGFILVTDPSSFRLMVSFSTLKLVLVPGLLLAAKDLFDMLSAARLDSTLFTTLQQTRLLGTALAMYFLLGVKQTRLQLNTLICITLVILLYCQIPNAVMTDLGLQENPSFADGKGHGWLGTLYALLSVLTSVFSGVTSQKAFQHPVLKTASLAVYVGSIQIVMSVTMALTLLVYIPASNWKHGAFGGEDTVWWRCQLEDSRDACHAREPVAIESQGFDYRTWIMIAFFVLSDFPPCAVTKLFDALVKSLLASSSLTLVYLVDVLRGASAFSVTQFLAAMLISMLVMNYSLNPKRVTDVAVDKESNGDAEALEEGYANHDYDNSASKYEDTTEVKRCAPKRKTAPAHFLQM